MFLWQIQLEPHAQHPDEWSVQKTENQFIIPNYPLFHLIDTLKGTGFTKRARTLAESGSIDPEALTQLARAVSETLQLEEDGLPLSVQPCPDKEALEARIESGQLRWSAVAGIFPTLPRTTVTEAPVVAPELPAEL